jgi:hypothetical protein
LATYTVNPGGGTLEINSRLTVTLPAGFTFNSSPSLAVSSGGATLALIQGGSGSQFAVFEVDNAPISGGESVTLGSFAVATGTLLDTPIPVAAALPLTMQATNNALTTDNDATPFSAGAFASEPGAVATFVGAFSTIDLAPDSFGEEFGPPDTPTTEIGRVLIQPEISIPNPVPLQQPINILTPAAAPNSLSTGDTVTVMIGGSFAGIQTAFASSSANCLSPISGTTATVSPFQIAVSGVPINQNNPTFLCMTSSGQTLLPQNPTGFTASVVPGTSTDFLGVAATITPGNAGSITYTNGGVVPVGNFFTGDDAGYSSLLRVNNAGTGTVQVFVLAQPDTGGPALIGPLATLGAGEGTVFTEPQVESSTGLNLANSGQRATIQLIIGGNAAEVAATTLLVNPGGVVDNVSLAAPPMLR